MDEVIRNLGPPVVVLLIVLFGWFDVWRMHQARRARREARRGEEER